MTTQQQPPTETTQYPICEKIDDYELVIDTTHQCYRDMNNSEIKIKYGNKPFLCCNTEFDIKKRGYFIGTHIHTNKHVKFVTMETANYKQQYGQFTDTAEQIQSMSKEIRSLKKSLHIYREEIRSKDTEVEKLNALVEKLNLENTEHKQKLKKLDKKKLRIDNLIDL